MTEVIKPETQTKGRYVPICNCDNRKRDYVPEYPESAFKKFLDRWKN